MRLVEEPVKPVKKRRPKTQSKRSVSTTASQTSKQVSSKPTRLPGDRNKPLLTNKVSPIYPKTALNNDWQGTVKVKVTVSKTGTVLAATVIRSSGHAILDQAFLRTIKDYYTFKPKREGGENKVSNIVVSYTFSLE